MWMMDAGGGMSDDEYFSFVGEVTTELAAVSGKMGKLFAKFHSLNLQRQS